MAHAQQLVDTPPTRAPGDVGQEEEALVEAAQRATADPLPSSAGNWQGDSACTDSVCRWRVRRRGVLVSHNDCAVDIAAQRRTADRRSGADPTRTP